MLGAPKRLPHVLLLDSVVGELWHQAAPCAKCHVPLHAERVSKPERLRLEHRRVLCSNGVQARARRWQRLPPRCPPPEPAPAKRARVTTEAPGPAGFLGRVKALTMEAARDQRVSWDEYFGGMALLAAARSPCERLHVAASSARPASVLSMGYNGFFQGAPHQSIMAHGHEQATVHAEQNAIAHAARVGISLARRLAHDEHATARGRFATRPPSHRSSRRASGVRDAPRDYATHAPAASRASAACLLGAAHQADAHAAPTASARTLAVCMSSSGLPTPRSRTPSLCTRWSGPTRRPSSFQLAEFTLRSAIMPSLNFRGAIS